eukprot:5153602-Pyramimonas_sp.AAC.1
MSTRFAASDQIEIINLANFYDHECTRVTQFYCAFTSLRPVETGSADLVSAPDREIAARCAVVPVVPLSGSKSSFCSQRAPGDHLSRGAKATVHIRVEVHSEQRSIGSLVYVQVGPPGSGKSTTAQRMMQQHDGWVRANQASARAR